MADWTSPDGAIRLIRGDCLQVLPALEAESVDAVVTDPPYSSGGQFRGDRMTSTRKKYQNSDTQAELPCFTGDNRDQRSFLLWASLWLGMARQASITGAVACVFADWRQLPTITDALQCGGWTWRNIATWWKPGTRMQKGRFSLSAEYVAYATNGPHVPNGEGSPQNVFRCATIPTAEREHMAQKPGAVMEWVLSATRRDATILDPFVGSGTTAVACIRTGRRFLGIEIDEGYFEIAKRRVEAELERHPLLDSRKPGDIRESGGGPVSNQESVFTRDDKKSQKGGSG